MHIDEMSISRETGFEKDRHIFCQPETIPELKTQADLCHNRNVEVYRENGSVF